MTWISFAEQTLLSPVASIDWDSVIVTRINWAAEGSVDITVQNPVTNDTLHLDTVDASSEFFSFPVFGEWNHNITLTPDNWWEIVNLNVYYWQNAQENQNTQEQEKHEIRNVIPATPKTWPSGNIIWIIIASLIIFGGYIFIKKQASL